MTHDLVDDHVMMTPSSRRTPCSPQEKNRRCWFPPGLLQIRKLCARLRQPPKLQWRRVPRGTQQPVDLPTCHGKRTGTDPCCHWHCGILPVFEDWSPISIYILPGLIKGGPPKEPTPNHPLNVRRTSTHAIGFMEPHVNDRK